MRLVKSLTLMCLAAASAAAFGSDVTIPHTFSNATPAVAAEVNNNFTAVKTAVDNNHARISALEATRAFPWVNVTEAAQKAKSNTGYLANNDKDQVLITLPKEAVLGDVVSVTGIGAAGWKIIKNEGQSIITRNVVSDEIGAVWTARESNRNWVSVASSADGSKLVAAVDGGQLYTSTDFGLSWTARDSNRNWTSVASSADGSKLAAAVDSQQLHTSTDFGANWTQNAAYQAWRFVVVSADGSKLFAVEPMINMSTDFGETWTQQSSASDLRSLASSADGSKLIASFTYQYGGGGGALRTSTDFGVSWTARDSYREWQHVASSADGSKLVASVNGGALYTSTDSGLTWTARTSGKSWKSLASSADGSKLVAAVENGQLYTSADSGVTWTARDSVRQWSSVASSADGSRLVAAEYSGSLYTSSVVSGSVSLSGAQHSAIDLQYIGNNTFIVRNHEGSVDVQ